MLARIALRMAAVEALKGQTLVGDNVLDSEITSLDADASGNLVSNQKKPFITVYTENSKSTGSGEPRALYETGTVDLVFEYAVLVTRALRNENNDVEVIPDIPAGDAEFEFYLDMVGRQIVDALNDPNNEWADIFRGLSYRVGKTECARTSNSDGERIAAHQIKMTVDLIDDPLTGEPLEEGTPFAEFLAKLEAAEDVPTLVKAAMMRAQIAGTNEPWEAVQRRLGLTRDELLALGLGPIAGDIERNTPAFGAGSVEVEGTGVTATVEQ